MWGSQSWLQPALSRLSSPVHRRSPSPPTLATGPVCHSRQRALFKRNSGHECRPRNNITDEVVITSNTGETNKLDSVLWSDPFFWDTPKRRTLH